MAARFRGKEFVTSRGRGRAVGEYGIMAYRARLSFQANPQWSIPEPLLFFAATLFEAKSLQLKTAESWTCVNLQHRPFDAHGLLEGPYVMECTSCQAWRETLASQRAVELAFRLRPAFWA
jgi:hypothetical protein